MADGSRSFNFPLPQRALAVASLDPAMAPLVAAA